MDLKLLFDPAILSELVFQGLVRGAMYALMGVGLALIFGILGIVNFAHGELFMLGAYAMFYCVAVLGLPFVVGVLAAAVLLFLVGVLIERGLIEPLRRRAGRDWLIDSFVLTIGLMVILQNPPCSSSAARGAAWRRSSPAASRSARRSSPTSGW